MESPENVMGTQIASPQLSKSAVPFSSGQAAPRLKAPDLACDCHMQILRAQDVAEKLKSLGVSTVAGSPEQLGAFQQKDTQKWGRVIRTAGIKID
jgi:hypothetical protein